MQGLRWNSFTEMASLPWCVVFPFTSVYKQSYHPFWRRAIPKNNGPSYTTSKPTKMLKKVFCNGYRSIIWKKRQLVWHWSVEYQQSKIRSKQVINSYFTSKSYNPRSMHHQLWRRKCYFRNLRLQTIIWYSRFHSGELHKLYGFYSSNHMHVIF